jgi:succinoglycan biosynthesis protein ExoL
MSSLRVLYLVHDVADAAVARRVAMMRDGGADVTVAGFRRADDVPEQVAGARVVDFGRTYNGGFVQRILSVLRVILCAGAYRDVFAQADVVVARNLEMLAIGVRGRSRCVARMPRVVYEVLDIHRLVLREDIIGRGLRSLEGWLAKNVDVVWTSSPAFVQHYFEARSKVSAPTFLVENKVYGAPLDKGAEVIVAGPPWRIGWFGVLRCRKSLDILRQLVVQQKGDVEVVIRGRVAYDQMPDFDEIVAGTDGLSFEGAYSSPDDLARIYGEVHFTWAVDMYEEGLNSSWLLPNRVYEGGLYGGVPLALGSVETGAFLKRLGVGVLLEPPLEENLNAFFSGLKADDYADYKASVLEVEPRAWACDANEAEAMMDELKGFARG